MTQFVLVLREEDKPALYYGGYQPRGGPIILTEKSDDAYRFPNKQFAENVLGGDERLKGGKVEALPN